MAMSAVDAFIPQCRKIKVSKNIFVTFKLKGDVLVTSKIGDTF